MVRSAVRVCVRLRPTEEPRAQEAIQVQNSKNITLLLSNSKAALGADKSQNSAQQYQFEFDTILQNASQEEVFEVCGQEAVQSALQGYNGTIMCYGQTGAGKTYTMAGGRQAYRERGIIPRALSALFTQLAAAPGLGAWRLTVSYLEIYNETLFDLLELTTAPHELNLYEDSRGRPQVAGLRRVAVASEADALALFFEGETNRVIGEHRLNRESSRSHAIFSIGLEMKPASDAGEGGRRMAAKLNLVDLAGSERVSKTRSEGLVLREAGHINKSLHLLEQVVLAINDRGRDHIPYRSSKLTHVLKDSLGGNCRTVLVANLWGSPAQLEESLSTCRFAARMAKVQCDVSANVVQESSVRVRQLEREVAELRSELAMLGMWGVGSGPSSGAAAAHEPLGEQQRALLRERAQAWLDAPAEGAAGGDALAHLQLTSMRMVREVLGVARGLYQQHKQQRQHHQQQQPSQLLGVLGGGVGSQRPQTSAPGSPLPAAGAWRTPPRSAAGSPDLSYMAAPADARPAAWGDAPAPAAGFGAGGSVASPTWRTAVGDPDDPADRQAGGVGAAPDHARPPAGSGGVMRAGPGPGSAATAARTVAFSSDGDAGGGLDVGRVLEQFRAGPGASMAAMLNDNHAKMRAAKRRAKELALQLNDAKRAIDALTGSCQQLAAARLARPEGEQQEVGAEEFEALSRLRGLKAAYRDAHGEMQAVRSEADYIARLLETCNAELTEAFGDWVRQTHGEAAAAALTGTVDVGAACSGPGGSRYSRGPSSSGASVYGASVPGSPLLASRRASTAVSTATARSRAGSLIGRLRAAPSPTPPPEDAGDPVAAAYYAAQGRSAGRTGGAGAAKQHLGEKGTFTASQRSSLASMAALPGRRPQDG